VSENGWFSSPDNVAFDRQGRLWIATDGFPRYGVADGAYVTDTEGAGRALTRQFYRTPRGAELCGPELNGDDTAYFAAIQHPGDTKGSTFDAPSTRWPDFKEGMPPRPAVQVIVKKGGGTVGS
jgi:secreted PhoX family phosphatase